MSKEKKLTQEKVLAWFGDDEKEDIAGYISSILNSLKEEGKSEISIDLFNEIYDYDNDEEE